MAQPKEGDAMTHTNGMVEYTTGRLPRVEFSERPHGSQYSTLCGVSTQPFIESCVANARRIAALWNMAERLGLSTEAIEAGHLESLLTEVGSALREHASGFDTLAEASWDSMRRHYTALAPFEKGAGDE